MKKTTYLLVSIAVFALTTSVARAWNYCFRDQLYTPQLQFNLDAPSGSKYVVRGQAVVGDPSNLNFPAPMAGYFDVNARVLSMTIGYKEADASRHYVWFLGASGAPAVTWGLLPNADYYESPRATQFVACPSAAERVEKGRVPSQLEDALSSLPAAPDDAGQGGATGAPFED
jgi:hypothetical protein